METHHRIEIYSGVPQGSILGLLLFILFINGIDEGFKSDILNFADVTNICVEVGPSVSRDKLKEELRVSCKWFDTWQAKFNTDKCQVMHTGVKNCEEEYFMVGKNWKR